MRDPNSSLRQAVVLKNTIYSYTLSYVMEEQAVYPRPNQRAPGTTSLSERPFSTQDELPLLRQKEPILFHRFDRRYKEGLELILHREAAQKYRVSKESFTYGSLSKFLATGKAVTCFMGCPFYFVQARSTL